MFEETKEAIEIIRKALEENQDAEDMTIQFIMDKDTAIKFRKELLRLLHKDETSRRIRHMEENEKDPAIRQVTCLYDTVDPMVSQDYKKRFYAEYWQLKIRYEKLKKFNNRIEAAYRTAETGNYTIVENMEKKVPMPKHDCPEGILREQQRTMGEYLHLLEVRSVIEGIDLDPEA